MSAGAGACVRTQNWEPAVAGLEPRSGKRLSINNNSKSGILSTVRYGHEVWICWRDALPPYCDVSSHARNASAGIGLVKKVTLCDVTVHALHDLPDRLGFYAFRHYLQAQRMSELDNCLHDRGAFDAAVDVPKKAPIDLKLRNRKLLKLCKARISRTEVVHGETDVRGAEGANTL